MISHVLNNKALYLLLIFHLIYCIFKIIKNLKAKVQVEVQVACLQFPEEFFNISSGTNLLRQAVELVKGEDLMLNLIVLVKDMNMNHMSSNQKQASWMGYNSLVPDISNHNSILLLNLLLHVCMLPKGEHAASRGHVTTNVEYNHCILRAVQYAVNIHINFIVIMLKQGLITGFYKNKNL